jgi:hypothetical protein
MDWFSHWILKYKISGWVSPFVKSIDSTSCTPCWRPG